MDKLVGKKFSYIGIKIGKAVVISEPRVLNDTSHTGKKKSAKTCKVRCSCGSEHEVLFNMVSNGQCKKCPVCNKGITGETKRVKSLFEYWMEQWRPETHKHDTYKLPFFKGGVGEEYIAGFCYVNKVEYEKFSRVMCIKPKNYILYNKSKDNCRRLAKEYKGCRKEKNVFIHREVIQCTSETADHINGLCLDNRSANIREATVRQNNVNTNKYKTSITGFRGVKYRDHKRKVTGKGEHKKIRPNKHYRASVTYKKSEIGLSFYTLEEAVEYRDTLNLVINKEFAYLNIPEKEQYYKDNMHNILSNKHLLFLKEEDLYDL